MATIKINLFINCTDTICSRCEFKPIITDRCHLFYVNLQETDAGGYLRCPECLAAEENPNALNRANLDNLHLRSEVKHLTEQVERLESEKNTWNPEHGTQQ